MRAPAGDAELRKFRRDRLAVGRGADVLVDERDRAVRRDVKSPARRERLIDADHAIRLRNRLRRIAQQGIVDAERLCERLVDLGRIDARRKVGDVKGPDVVATLTE